MWHFPSARFAPFCTPDTRSFIHPARDVDGRSEHDACGIRDETTETANSWRKQCRELCQNCAKTLSNCEVGAYFEQEADSPKLLETLESGSKGRNRWNAGSCLQSRCTVRASGAVNPYQHRSHGPTLASIQSQRTTSAPYQIAINGRELSGQ